MLGSVKPPYPACIASGTPWLNKKEKMSDKSDCIQIRFKEKASVSPGERVRAVGMCFYGCGRDLVKGKTYRLERNPATLRTRGVSR